MVLIESTHDGARRCNLAGLLQLFRNYRDTGHFMPLVVGLVDTGAGVRVALWKGRGFAA